MQAIMRLPSRRDHIPDKTAVAAALLQAGRAPQAWTSNRLDAGASVRRFWVLAYSPTPRGKPAAGRGSGGLPAAGASVRRPSACAGAGIALDATARELAGW